MALYLGHQKRGCFLTTLCSAVTSLLQVKCPFACHVDGGEWSVSCPEFFTPGERGHYHWVESWLGPRAGLHTLENNPVYSFFSVLTVLAWLVELRVFPSLPIFCPHWLWKWLFAHSSGFPLWCVFKVLKRAVTPFLVHSSSEEGLPFSHCSCKPPTELHLFSFHWLSDCHSCSLCSITLTVFLPPHTLVLKMEAPCSPAVLAVDSVTAQKTIMWTAPQFCLHSLNMP